MLPEHILLEANDMSLSVFCSAAMQNLQFTHHLAGKNFLHLTSELE